RFTSCPLSSSLVPYSVRSRGHHYSFPTRRSSDLFPDDARDRGADEDRLVREVLNVESPRQRGLEPGEQGLHLVDDREARRVAGLDRKSTRLNPVTSGSRMPSSA